MVASRLVSFTPMSKLVIRSLTELEQRAGQELGVSAFHPITQEQINQFAAATLDYQWIHVDAGRARRESPFRATIAHGYLTVALLPYLWQQIVTIENLKMEVNYEIEALRFNQAVAVNSAVRLRARLLSVANLRGIAKARLAGERIAAVIGCTAFEAGEGRTPFVVDFDLGVAEVTSAETAGRALEEAAALAQRLKAG